MSTLAPPLRRKSVWRIVRREYVLYFMVLPALVFTILFHYLPLFMNVMAFMDFQFTKGFLGLASPWVGLRNFQRFLTDPAFHAVALRTLWYALANLVFSFPAPIILALLLNELRNQIFKRTVQTISYLPFFVSWVTVAGLIYMFLGMSSSGILNNIVEFFGGRRTAFMAKSEYFLGVLVFSTLWKGTGLGSIIYLATIASIEQQLYEAARIDGAGRWKQLRHITIPGIMPAIIILLILNAGTLFSANFDQMINLQNSVIQTDTDVINTYSYYVGILQRRYGVGTAIGLFQALVNFALVWITNLLAKRIRGTGLF